MSDVHAEPVQEVDVATFVETLTDLPTPEERRRVFSYFMRNVTKGVVAHLVWYKAEPICICGAFELMPGVCQCWVHARPDAAKFGFSGSVTRLLRRLVLDVCRDKGYHRAQVQVTEAEGATVMRWVEAMGFKFESTMEKYSPDGSDTYMLVMLP